MRYNYVNSFMRSYKVIIEEKARQSEYMRKVQLDKILKQHHDRLLRIEKNIKKK